MMNLQQNRQSSPWIKVTLFLCLVIVSCHSVQAGYKQGVRLSDVKVLTLYADRLTSGSQRIPQLKCTGGSAGCSKSLQPQVAQCQNMGSDGFDVQWKCEAEMHKSVKFGRIEVSCEGLTRPDDPYVVKDSCGLEYTLERIDGSYDQASYSPAYVFVAFIVMVILVISCFSGRSESDPQSRAHHTRASAPPPPYSASSAPPPPGFKTSYADYSSPPSSGNDGPGFWSGMMAGGGLGYLFGRSQTETPYRQRPSSSYYNNYDSFGTSSSYRNSTNDGERHTSTGYGGTKRR